LIALPVLTSGRQGAPNTDNSVKVKCKAELSGDYVPPKPQKKQGL